MARKRGVEDARVFSRNSPRKIKRWSKFFAE
jgi:hypothetical protein